MHRILLDLTPASSWIVRRMSRMNPTILVPVAPDMNSVISLQMVEKFFAGVNDGDGRPLQPFYVLNQFDTSLPLHLDVREVMRRQLGDRLLPFVIRRAPAVSEALAEGMTVVDYAPDAPVAEDYLNLATWLRTVAAPATAGFRNVRWSETMTGSPLFRQFESGENLFFKLLRFVTLAGGILLLAFTGILDLTWPQQIVLGILTVALVVWLDRSSSSYVVTLTLLLVSTFSTFRYGYWRYCDHRQFFSRSRLGSLAFSTDSSSSSFSSPRPTPSSFCSSAISRRSGLCAAHPCLSRRPSRVARNRSPHSYLQRAP